MFHTGNSPLSYSDNVPIHNIAANQSSFGIQQTDSEPKKPACTRTTFVLYYYYECMLHINMNKNTIIMCCINNHFYFAGFS